MSQAHNVAMINSINTLRLSLSGTAYSWVADQAIRAAVEQTDRTNIFSNISMGAVSTKFVIWNEIALTMHNAILHNNLHYMITGIKPVGRKLEIAAAQLTPRTFQLYGATLTLDKYNRPSYGTSAVQKTFPAYLAEQYIRAVDQSPQTLRDEMYNLITPKAIDLAVGDVVVSGSVSYAVRARHMLDEYKNEYEVAAKEDA